MNVSVLESFSRSLAPQNDIIDSVSSTINKVVVSIQKNGNRFGVDRAIIAGSLGKRTAIENFFDVDLVIFINSSEPPFKEEIERIEELLYLNFNDFLVLHKSDKSLKASVNKVGFDILLATNYVVGGPHQPNKRREQHRALLSKFNPETSTWKDTKPYSCGFCETVVDFIQNQNEIVHSAIRLAKFWMWTLVLLDHRHGFSYATELLIAHAAKVLTGRFDELSVPSIFNEYLKQIVNWQQLKAFWTEYYTENQISSRCRAQMPLLLDPSNPWNNVAMEIPWEKLSVFAASALRKWENPMMPVQELFAVQFDPEWTQEMKRLAGGVGSQTFRRIHSSILISRASILLPLDYHSNILCNNIPSIPQEFGAFVYSLQSMLLTSLRLSSFLQWKGYRETVRDVVAQCFATCLSVPTNWHAVNDDNSIRNVSIRFPLFLPGANAYVEVVSFDIA